MAENSSQPIKVSVCCYAGYRGEQTPQKFTLWNHDHTVSEIVDQWLAPDYRYFKVKAEDGGIYILRHDNISQEWELTMFITARGVQVLNRAT